MCIVFTCGEHTFRKEVEGYEGIVCRCFNCGNYSARVIKTHPWFSFCFVPVIPLSIHGYEDVTCHICNFAQPLEHRQDVQALRKGGPGVPAGGGVPPGVPLQQPSPQPYQPQPGPQYPPQGFNSPPPPPNQNIRYG